MTSDTRPGHRAGAGRRAFGPGGARSARSPRWRPDRRTLRVLGWLVLAAVVIQTQFAPAFTLFRYQVVIAYALAALGIYLTFQIAGEFMIGHVAIVGGAAYGVALAGQHTEWGPIAAVLVALLVGAVIAVILGLPGMRLSALYLGIISLFPVLIFDDVAKSFEDVTGGENGLRVPPFDLGVDLGPNTGYLVALLLLLLAFLFIRNIVMSSWGARLRTLRDAPQALDAAGISRNRTKVAVYVLSSVPASLSGWLLAYVNGVVLPGFFGMPLTLTLIAACIIGGTRSVIGVLIAVLILSGYTELVGPFSEFNQLGLGLLLLAVIVAAPSGLDSLRSFRLRRRREEAAGEGTVGDLTVDVTVEQRDPDLPLRTERREHGSATAVLEVVNIDKAFGGNVALADVSFSLEPGRIVGLVGANGSGKTTLINVITGFLRPDRGTAYVLGHNVTGRAPHKVSRAGVSRTFQVPRLVDDLSVRRNIEVGMLTVDGDGIMSSVLTGGRSGAARKRRRARVDEVATILGLPLDVLETRTESLSLGMKRVVEVGRAIAGGACVICLDEPAAGLNDAEIERLGRTLDQVARSGCAVLLVEHHMNFVMEVCDDILVLERGTLIGWTRNDEGTPLPEALRRHIGVGQ